MALSPLRVLIVDDDGRVRRAIRALLDAEPDKVVVGEAATAAEARRAPAPSVRARSSSICCYQPARRGHAYCPNSRVGPWWH